MVIYLLCLIYVGGNVFDVSAPVRAAGFTEYKIQ